MKKIILACLLLPFLFSSAYAEEHIGTVNKVKTYAYGTKVNENRGALFTRDDVYQNEIIETVKDGAIWIIFNDDTDLYMDESGQLTLNEFVYSPDGNGDSMIVNLTKGLFRFITGSIAAENIIITTPVATMGIRGTDVEITVDNTGTKITAFEGVITVDSAYANVVSEGCQTLKITASGYLFYREPCPPGGPSIGPFTFDVGHSGGGGHSPNNTTPSNDVSEPNHDEPSHNEPSHDNGGPGNGNGNAGNLGNGGGNINGSGPGTGNNGSNNGHGDNGGGGHGNGGKHSSNHTLPLFPNLF